MSTSYNRFFPVIHCIAPGKGGLAHALVNTKIAFHNGADGIFLIGHRLRYGEVLTIYEEVRRHFPFLWIGVNFLDISASDDWQELFRVAMGVNRLDGLWVDRLPRTESTSEICRRMELFGGVAFKYIDPNPSAENLKRACEEASRLVQCVTTSGDATGSAPAVKKMADIRSYISPFAGLALASGVSTSNVQSFLPYVDTFLVASSITRRRVDMGNQEYLDPHMTQELADLIHV
jgi:hypothetical protein